MAMDRWDPLRDMMSLRDAMEHLIQDNFVRPVGSLLPTLRATVPLDVIEKPDAFEVRASLPGIKPADVEISVQGRTLIIRGESAAEQEHRGEHWILHERRSGTFARSVTLPAAVEADQAVARFDQGVLIIEIPKVEAAKAKPIAVRDTRQSPANGQQHDTPT
jgi:HSP20 family protein